MSTIHGHLGMWNPASSSSSSASWASSSSSASQEQCHQCLPFFHGIQCIQCIHGKLYSRCKPCVSWCFMLQSSISGTMQIPNHPPAVLSLPSRQYQGTASDPFSWQARRLVPIISKNEISIIKETITKNNKDSIRQYSHIFKASNIYSNIVFLTIVLKQKGWDANQTNNPANLPSISVSLYTTTCLSAFFKGGSPCFFGSHPISMANFPVFKFLCLEKKC